MRQPYRVTALIFKEASFEVDAVSPEEAESIVEDWISEGEEGTLESFSIDSIEAVPVEEFGDALVEAR